MTKMQLYLDINLKKQLELKAKKQNTSLSALIRDIALEYLESSNKQLKNPLLKYATTSSKLPRISLHDNPGSLSEEIDNIVYGKSK
jgi:Ribbon-helix-helix protein, copG family